MIADLGFYNENYGGDSKIPAVSFPLWERRASAYLMHITGGKIEGKDDAKIKMCVCEMAECLYESQKNDGIKSENNDGYSVTYQERDTKTELMKIAETYLGGTAFLYRGVDNES